MSILKRGGTYQLRKRVPKRFQDIEPRAEIWVSLRTDSEAIARRKADDVWMQIIDAWEAKLAGQAKEAAERYEAARKLADLRGFRFLDVGKVSDLPIEDLIARVEAVENRIGEPDVVEATAILGTAERPKLTIEAALEEYWDFARDKTIGKNEDQMRRWRNPRIKAVRNLVALIGNKPIREITRDDMLDFRQYWLDRIETGDVTPGTANKDLIHIGDVLKTINRVKRLGLDLPLGELSFKQGEKRTRPPFSVKWIKSRILKDGALSSLNGEARAILLGMINTGYRPSEGAALTAKTIRLGHEVPHISIEAEGRQLKTAYARRLIPLTGVSLEAFKQYPEGFDRYRHKAGLSATVNKYLREHDLLETPQHSFYSLRHAFEDRMLAGGIDERIRRDLFGHRLNRERYGHGASLAHMADLVVGIAI